MLGALKGGLFKATTRARGFRGDSSFSPLAASRLSALRWGFLMLASKTESLIQKEVLYVYNVKINFILSTIFSREDMLAKLLVTWITGSAWDQALNI